MSVYYIQSGWRTGLVIARSSLHALQVAIDTGLHKTGNDFKCFRVNKETLNESVIRLIPHGPGRLLMPSLFRLEPLLLTSL